MNVEKSRSSASSKRKVAFLSTSAIVMSTPNYFVTSFTRTPLSRLDANVTQQSSKAQEKATCDRTNLPVLSDEPEWLREAAMGFDFKSKRPHGV